MRTRPAPASRLPLLALTAVAALVLALAPAGAHAGFVTGIDRVDGSVQVAGGAGFPYLARYDAMTGALQRGFTYDNGLPGSFVAVSYADATGATHAVIQPPTGPPGSGEPPFYTRIGPDGQVVAGLERVDLGVPAGAQPFAIFTAAGNAVVALNGGREVHFRFVGPGGESRGGNSFQAPGGLPTFGNGKFRDGADVVLFGRAGSGGFLARFGVDVQDAIVEPDLDFSGDGYVEVPFDGGVTAATKASSLPTGDIYTLYGIAGSAVAGQSFLPTGDTFGSPFTVPGTIFAYEAKQPAANAPIVLGAAVNTGGTGFGFGFQSAGGSPSAPTQKFTPFGNQTFLEDMSIDKVTGTIFVGWTDFGPPPNFTPGPGLSAFDSSGTPLPGFGGGHVRVDPTLFTTVTLGTPDPNEPPVISAPGDQTADEDRDLVFSQANGNAISVSDPDAGGAPVVVQLSVGEGTLHLATTAGVTFPDPAAPDGSDVVEIQGPLPAIAAALDGLRYRPRQNFDGPDTLSIVADDLGNAGSGGPKVDTASVGIDVAPVNDPPLNSVPGAQGVARDGALTFSQASGNAISVADIDAGSGEVEVFLKVTDGTLQVAPGSGVGFPDPNAPDGSNLVIVRGGLTSVNSALDGLTYRPRGGFSGGDQLVVVSNDLGNSGSGGAMSDLDGVDIAVTAPTSGGGGTGSPAPPELPPCGQRPGLAIVGTAAPDVLLGTVGDDPMSGVGGGDTMNGDDGNDRMRGGRGDDRMNGSLCQDGVFGDGGNDRLFGEEDRDTVDGGLGDDPLVSGGPGDDTVNGGRGDDRANGDAGSDRVDGGDGTDNLDGGSGGDSMLGGDDADRMSGGSGDDTMRGQAGGDLMRGNEGDDRVLGNSGRNDLFGNDGNDFLQGGLLVDTMVGGDGNDRLQGDLGGDDIEGGRGSDRMFGQGGDDELRDGPQVDRVFGARGNDAFFGGDGADDYFGQEGNDTFRTRDGARDDVDCGRGRDRVIAADPIDRLIGCEIVP